MSKISVDNERRKERGHREMEWSNCMVGMVEGTVGLCAVTVDGLW